MFQPEFQDALHVVVCEGVVHVFAVPTRAHKVALTEDPQLVGNGGRTHAQLLRQVGDAQLAVVQSPQHFQAGAVPEHLEEIRQVADILVRQHVESLLASVVIHND